MIKTRKIEEKLLIDNYKKKSEIHGNIGLGKKEVNKAAKELIRMNEYLRENIAMAKKVVDELLYFSNANTQIWIAGLAIDIKYKEEEAIHLLKTIGDDKSVGIIAMNARLCLADKNIVPINNW